MSRAVTMRFSLQAGRERGDIVGIKVVVYMVWQGERERRSATAPRSRSESLVRV